MVVYKLALYSGDGTCIYEKDWGGKDLTSTNAPLPTPLPAPPAPAVHRSSTHSTCGALTSDEAQKLTYGLLITLRTICARLQLLQPVQTDASAPSQASVRNTPGTLGTLGTAGTAGVGAPGTVGAHTQFVTYSTNKYTHTSYVLLIWQFRSPYFIHTLHLFYS